MPATVVQINVSGGGMPKLPVPEANITYDGVEGDWQLNRKYHGGTNRAICLYSVELYQWLRDQGIALEPGQLGENLTIRGLDLLALKPGDRFRVGEAVIQITEPRVPCVSLDRWDPKLKTLMRGRAGWLGKVLKEGLVRSGDEIALLSDEE